MRNLILVILLIMTINSCSWVRGASTPFLAFTTPKVPDGTPAFQKGFKHGCNNGLYSRGNVFYRNINKFQTDTNLLDNPEYMFGLRRGYGYCFVVNAAAADGANGSPDQYIFPDYNATFSAQDYNDTGFLKDSKLIAPFVQTQATGDGKGGLDGIFDTWSKGGGGGGDSAFGGNPLWAGGSKLQIFGQ